MKVLIDTNVFLSYILTPDTPRVVTAVVTTCFSQDAIELLVPPEQLAEFRDTVASRRYFRTRIPRREIDHFMTQLIEMSELLSPLEDIAAYTRDPKDDYLVAYGVVNEAEFLVTGDADLLVLDHVSAMEIVKPSEFAGILRERGYLP